MKTYSLSAKDIEKAWHVLDASGQTLGRLSTQVAGLLMGKHKPTFSPHLDMGDFVIIVNAEKVRVTGKKLDDKIYYRHSGHIGGLKETVLGDMLQRHPGRVIELAVRGMLPRNRLSRHLLRHLKVYAGPDHPHEAQVNESRKIEEGREKKAAAALAAVARVGAGTKEQKVQRAGPPSASRERGVGQAPSTERRTARSQGKKTEAEAVEATAPGGTDE